MVMKTCVFMSYKSRFVVYYIVNIICKDMNC